VIGASGLGLGVELDELDLGLNRLRSKS